MKIVVIFEFEDVRDIDSSHADEVIDSLSIDLKKLAKDNDCDWYIDDVH
jgi:hypothetical protein